MFHSTPLNTNVILPYGELIVALGLPSIVVLAVIVIGLIAASPSMSFITNTVPVRLTGNIIDAGIGTATAK
jgi:hypothetical protein